MYEQERHSRRHGSHDSRVGGAVLIAIGVAIFFRRTFHIDFPGFAWPFFIIGPGLAFFVAMFFGGRGAGSLAIPGSVITTIGLILLGQSLFDYFESWAYIWALIPTAAGVGLIIAGLWDGKPKMISAGTQAASSGLVMLLIFGTFFELFIFHGAGIAAYAWPIVLISIGAFQLVRGRLKQRTPTMPSWTDGDVSEPNGPNAGSTFPY